MRKKLKQINGERRTFRGTFECFGTKNGWKGEIVPTVLLVNITTPDGELLADHLWFNLTKQFKALDLQPGDMIEFDARVKPYTKGYFGRREDVYKPIETDYKLSHPTKVRLISRKAATSSEAAGTPQP